MLQKCPLRVLCLYFGSVSGLKQADLFVLACTFELIFATVLLTRIHIPDILF